MKFSYLILCLAASVFFAGCSKSDRSKNNPSSKLPTVTTSAVNNITSSKAGSGGNVTSQGNDVVTARGVCWSTTSQPSLSNLHTTDGTGTGTFTSSISALNQNTPYFVRAYATNSSGTSYGNVLNFTTTWDSAGSSLSDIEGNVYHTVTIGTKRTLGSHTWMAENLKTTLYNDGTAITLVTDNDAWKGMTAAAYCWYNNDAPTYKNTYGALYNFYAVETGKLCPMGWHVPSDSDWVQLITYLGGEDVDGGKLKAKGTLEAGTGLWKDPNYGATNSSGFTGIPAGHRVYTGTFGYMGEHLHMWSSTEFNFSDAWLMGLEFNFTGASTSTESKPTGLSVRCIRNN